LKKLKEHGNGIALIFAKTETKAFFDYIWEDAHSILFIKKRLRFIKHDLSSAGASTAPSVLISYGENNTEFIRKSNISGKLVTLK
jgi:hypothetical protein